MEIIMHRRDFIRLAGGGAVLAATVPLSGCNGGFPADTVTAWAGPGDDPDPRRWALAHAILAPNSHNRQPWLVDLRQPQTIVLHVDRERLLPETDPWFRQIMVSQGTFLEILVLALRQRGIEPQVQLFPDGEPGARQVDDRPVARITWPAGAASAARDPLFAQVLRRHTAKVAYDTSRPVAQATLDTLRASGGAPAVSGASGTSGVPSVAFGGTVDPQRLGPLRQLCLDAAKVELLTPRTVMESLRLTRVGPEEIRRHRDGISLNAPMPRLMAAAGLFDRSQPPAEGSAGYKAMLQRFEEHSLSAMGFVWLSTPWAVDAAAGRTRSAEVAAGRAYLRLHLKATELGLQMHPLSQAPQEFAEMKPFYDQMHQLLLGRPATQEVVQMLCRVGYCADQPHTPRRELASFMRA
jgi:hypothetical protein